MADLFTNTNDGRILSPTTTWAGARDANTGGSVVTNDIRHVNFTAVNRFGSRGGGNTYRVERSYMYFDTSGIAGVVTSATIQIRGYSGNDGSVIAVKSTAFGGDGGTALSTADFDAIVGWTDGTSADGNVTNYSSPITSGWSTSGYNSLNSTEELRTDMQNDNVVIICFMDYSKDYLNNTPSVNGTVNNGAFYTDYSATNLHPYIEYVEATTYGHNVLGIAASSLHSVNGVTRANIAHVNGVG